MIFTALPTLPFVDARRWLYRYGVASKAKEETGRGGARAAKEAGRSGQSRTTREEGGRVFGCGSMRIELGAKLIPLADPNRGRRLDEAGLHRPCYACQRDGDLAPMVRIKDRMNLPEYKYEVMLSGDRIASGLLRPIAC